MTRARAAIAGIVATVLALATAELLLAMLPGTGSLFVAVGNVVIEATPGPVVGFAIDTFGSANRLVLLSSMTVGMGAAGALIALGSVRRPWIAPVGFGLFGVAGAAAGAADPAITTSSAVLATIGGVVVGAGALAKVLDVLRDGDPSPDRGAASTEVEPLATRRRFLGWTAALAGTAGVLLATGRFFQDRTAATVARATTDLPAPAQALPPPPMGASLEVDGISPLLTPNEDFYRIDTAFTIPRVDASTHRISFTGMVDRPFELTFDELLELADTEVDVTLSCVSNQVGGDLIGTARWLGVPLAELLDRAGVQSGADQIVGRSVDGWTGGFPVEAAFDGRPAIIAVGMNGEPLPARHGFPARLVIAGLYGYVSDTKWLSEIELTTFDAFDAYWVPRGWSALGPIKTQSRIDVPRDSASVDAGTVAVAGVAWSDERGVSAVEVSVDDGPWQPADLADELATTTWRQWVYRWDAAAGNHVLRVRASDADGRPQTPDVAPPAPDGATGHHTVRVSVT
jgi:DMSO/TMAO reductase YedYZ molybdopterin-dependent catalytic subunit